MVIQIRSGRAGVEPQTILPRSPRLSFTFSLYTEQCDEQVLYGQDENQKERRKERRERGREQVSFGVEVHLFGRICRVRSRDQKLDMRDKDLPGIEE